jgi:hypothetical protein
MPTARKYYLIFFSSKISVGSASFYDWHVLSCLFQSLKVFFSRKNAGDDGSWSEKNGRRKNCNGENKLLTRPLHASVSQDESDTALQK